MVKVPGLRQNKIIRVYLTISRQRLQDKEITSLYSHSFSINLKRLANKNQHNFTKIHFKFITVLKRQKTYSHWSVTITAETVNFDQSESRKINSHQEISTKGRQLYPTKICKNYALTSRLNCFIPSYTKRKEYWHFILNDPDWLSKVNSLYVSDSYVPGHQCAQVPHENHPTCV